MYLSAECLDLTDSSSPSSSLHCLASSSEWTLMTSLMTCRGNTVMTYYQFSLLIWILIEKGSSIYLSVGFFGDVNILGSVGLTPPLVVPHLCHQFQVSLWFVLSFICTDTDNSFFITYLKSKIGEYVIIVADFRPPHSFSRVGEATVVTSEGGVRSFLPF